MRFFFLLDTFFSQFIILIFQNVLNQVVCPLRLLYILSTQDFLCVILYWKMFFLLRHFRFSETILGQYTYDFTKIIIPAMDPLFFWGGGLINFL
jgi:hypothetical protein